MTIKPNTEEVSDDRKQMGERLKESREYLGFSQDQVANFLGISRSAISLIEAGQRKVDAIELKKLAGLFKRQVSHFTGEEIDEVLDSAEVKHLARKVSSLSEDDRKELSRFADFLRARKKSKGD
jgi:transcriptional regulator with XRE-family HTH domain